MRMGWDGMEGEEDGKGEVFGCRGWLKWRGQQEVAWRVVGGCGLNVLNVV